MPKLSIERSHSLEAQDAKQRINSLVEQMKSEFPSLISKIDWSSDGQSAKVQGKMFNGDFKLTESKVSVELNLSLFAKPFIPKIEKEIHSVLDKQFGTAG